MKIPRYGKLSARLRELGLSQTDLAYALRLSPGAVSQRMVLWSAGYSGLKKNMVLKLSKLAMTAGMPYPRSRSWRRTVWSAWK